MQFPEVDDMGYKKLTKDDMYTVDELLSQAEGILRNSRLDDECYLINNIRNYIRMKRSEGINEVKPNSSHD